jgi:fatty acid amide hydrolase
MEHWKLGAAELARFVAQGSVTAREVVEAHIARVEAVNPVLNALVVKRYDAALAEADAVDCRRAAGEPLGSLAGVPVTIKESLDVAGLPSSYGLLSLASVIAASDGAYVARLRRAGAIVIGKTNLSQLMIFIESDNPVYGRSNNPWNLERSPGGSSGGEGASVASGCAPLGFGSDIGGSIRNPATSCGVVGFKPTAGRLPDTTRLPVFAGAEAIVSSEGPFARCVDDVALALGIANDGPNPDVLPPRPLGDPVSVDVGTLRVGVCERIGSFAAAPALARAAREAGAALAGMGATVVPFEVPHADRAQDLFFGILSADGTRGARLALGSDPRDVRVAELIGIASKPRSQLAIIERLLQVSGEHSLAAVVRNYGRTDTYHYWKLTEAVRAYAVLFAAAMDAAHGAPLDVLLLPPSGLPALPHGMSRQVLTAGMYAPLFNLLGYPAGSLPWTRVGAGEEVGRKRSRDRVERGAYETEVGSAGLPIGVQVVARPWRDHVALAAMKALETVARSRADFPITPTDPPSAPTG